ncbi:MAG: cell division protein FtsH, partial [Prevotellaceae bacterium]|nr:cell division protein FtsH [Prevotellaceae bacterium]
LIDEEVKKMVNEQYERAKKILVEHKDGHAQLTQMLIDKEVIYTEDVENIFGKRPWASRSEEIIGHAADKPAEKEEKAAEKEEKAAEKKEEKTDQHEA